MILTGIISQEEAFRAVDWNVIFLLIGMMIITGVLKKTGFFQYVAIKAAKITRGDPFRILIMLVIITAFLSAFLDNVTTVLMMAPASILIAVELGISPLPYLIAEAIASNIGGTATLIGDPPNIMIGSAAGLGFLSFLKNLTPIITVLLGVFLLLLKFFFGKGMVVTTERRARIMEFDLSRVIEDPVLLKKTLLILILVIIGFLLHEPLHLEVATIALSGAFLLLLLSGESPYEIFHEVEWTSIFFFVGLFIMVGGLVELGVLRVISSRLLHITGGNLPLTSFILLWASGTICSVFNNIPYVATVIPIVQEMGTHLGSQAILPLWWALALGACLGGNGTMVGAAANVVVSDIAGRSGYRLSFLEFTKYGVIVTFINLLISTLYLYFLYLR